MESIFGIVGKDFVLLAADSKAARSILVYKDDEDKMMELDSHKVIVGNGPISDRIEFCEYIQKNMKLNEMHHGVALNGHAAANFIRGELASALRSSPYQINLLVGSCDKLGDGAIQPSLYWMDYFAAMVKVNFGVHGYGSNFCLSIFDREWKPDMTLEECQKVLAMCKAELEERFLVKSGKWMYKVIDANGIRNI